MRETQLLAAARGMCGELGIWAYHSRHAVRCRRCGSWCAVSEEPGWPDLSCLGRGGAIFAELKSDNGRRSRAQLRAADRITRAGLCYELWRPADVASGAIAAALRRIRGLSSP